MEVLYLFGFLTCAAHASKAAAAEDTFAALLSKMEKFERRQGDQEERLAENRLRIAELEARLEKKEMEPATMSVCGYMNQWSISGATVLYSHLFHQETNLATGGLDKYRGVFTAGLSGVHLITWSLLAENRPPAFDYPPLDPVDLHLHLNGQEMPEARHVSWSGKANDDVIYELGGRTVMLSLEEGDKLERQLRPKHCRGHILHCTHVVFKKSKKLMTIFLPDKLNMIPICHYYVAVS